jgi:hypothetical protein
MFVYYSEGGDFTSLQKNGWILQSIVKEYS